MKSRNKLSGFILLDVMVALAIAALSFTIILRILPYNALLLEDRFQRYLASEFAFSVLEEYRNTPQLIPMAGMDISGWGWSIEEQVVKSDSKQNFNQIILTTVTVTAWHIDHPGIHASVRGIIARSIE